VRNNESLLLETCKVLNNLSQKTPNEAFYFLSVTTKLLHRMHTSSLFSLQMEDPILKGVLPLSKMNGLSPGYTFEMNLHILAFQSYQKIIQDICEKIEPLIVSAVLEVEIIFDSTKNRKGSLLTPTAKILRIFSNLLESFRSNEIYSSIVYQAFAQIYSNIDCVLFNAMMKKDRLSAMEGIQVKAGMAELDEFVSRISYCSQEEEGRKDILFIFSRTRNQMHYMQELSTLLMAEKTNLIAYPFTPSQLKKIIMLFVPDEFSPSPIHETEIQIVEELITNEGLDPSDYFVPTIQIKHLDELLDT